MRVTTVRVVPSYYPVMKRFVPLIWCFIAACTKKDEVAPIITIEAPIESQAFTAGQTVTIKANITDNVGVHMIHIIAVDNTGGHWVHSEEHVDGKSFERVKTFIANAGKNYTISVEATDHDENSATKEIHISCN
jgi:Bacterial Ig domain